MVARSQNICWGGRMCCFVTTFCARTYMRSQRMLYYCTMIGRACAFAQQTLGHHIFYHDFSRQHGRGRVVICLLRCVGTHACAVYGGAQPYAVVGHFKYLILPIPVGSVGRHLGKFYLHVRIGSRVALYSEGKTNRCVICSRF